MNWVSMFRLMDAMYVIFILMALQGSAGFVWQKEPQRKNPSALE
jgi:hypothetical protein